MMHRNGEFLFEISGRIGVASNSGKLPAIPQKIGKRRVVRLSSKCAPFRRLIAAKNRSNSWKNPAIGDRDRNVAKMGHF